MIKNKKEDKSIFQSDLKIGDIFSISENQKSLLKDPKAVSILSPTRIPYFNIEELEIKIREFLAVYPELCVKYINKQGEIKQQFVGAEKVLLDVAYKKINKEIDEQKLISEGTSFLKRDCDFFKRELIRVIIFDDIRKKDELVIVLGIHYSLIDMQTNMMLSNNLFSFFNNQKFDRNYISSFFFAEWQKKYLESEKAKEKKQFWIDLVKKANLTKDKNHDFESQQTFISQKLIIKGSDFENMKFLVRKVNLPLTGVLMTLHQRMLNIAFPDSRGVQLIRVDGREQVFDDFDIKKVLGMVANSLPIPIAKQNKMSRSLIFDVYIAYCNARLNQDIPYEVIKNEILFKDKVNIDNHILGLYNYVSLEHIKREFEDDMFLNNQLFYKKKKKLNQEKPINLYNVLYDNSLEIEMTCRLDVYEKNKSLLNLNHLISNELINAIQKD
ncbi:condensation domain-containing protein [Tenacibaculum ascidiaceicola]|uniref:condensation domain-containing protein n=2 Tax=Flavobacteriaceae TaxID=49546 RepID=UPI0039EB929A